MLADEDTLLILFAPLSEEFVLFLTTSKEQDAGIWMLFCQLLDDLLH